MKTSKLLSVELYLLLAILINPIYNSFLVIFGIEFQSGQLQYFYIILTFLGYIYILKRR